MEEEDIEFFDDSDVQGVIMNYVETAELPETDDIKENLINISRHYDMTVEKFAERDFNSIYGGSVHNYSGDFENNKAQIAAEFEADKHLESLGFYGFDSPNFVGAASQGLKLARKVATKSGREGIKQDIKKVQNVAKRIGQAGKFLANKGQSGQALFAKNTAGSRPMKQNTIKNKVLDIGRKLRQNNALIRQNEIKEDKSKLMLRALDLQARALRKYDFDFDVPLVQQANALVNSKTLSSQVLDAFEKILEEYKLSQENAAVNEAYPKLILGAVALMVLAYIFAKKT